MKYKTAFFIIVLFFTQCTSEIGGEIKYIYKLSSPDNRIDIYECYIESPMAFGSGHFERTILNRKDTYHPRKLGNFNEYTILGWVGNDTLKVIKFHSKQNREIKIPEENLGEIRKYGDFYVDIIHRTSYGGAKNWFRFDTIFFTSDSVFFLQIDSLGGVKGKLGLLKGQIRFSNNQDTVTSIIGEYYEKIEDHFAKITDGNDLGYPYIVRIDCEFIPTYRLDTSIFNNQPITKEMNIENYN
jgi:hypothetical protein